MKKTKRKYNIKRKRNCGKWSDSQLFGAIMSEMRRVHKLRWLPSRVALKRAKVDKHTARCERCGDIKDLYMAGMWRGKPKRVRAFAADHIVPVVDPHEERGPSAKQIREWAEKGGTKEELLDMIKPCVPDWNVRFDNMFVEDDGYQVLCYECHKKKTDAENTERRMFRKKMKWRRDKSEAYTNGQDEEGRQKIVAAGSQGAEVNR